MTEVKAEDLLFSENLGLSEFVQVFLIEQ